MVVPQNGWLIMNIPLEMDDFGGTSILGNLHIRASYSGILHKSIALQTPTSQSQPCPLCGTCLSYFSLPGRIWVSSTMYVGSLISQSEVSPLWNLAQHHKAIKYLVASPLKNHRKLPWIALPSAFVSITKITIRSPCWFVKKNIFMEWSFTMKKGYSERPTCV